MRAVYNELHNTLMAIDEQEDLRWWKNTHGPGMPTDWPHFQVSVPPSPSPRTDVRFRCSRLATLPMFVCFVSLVFVGMDAGKESQKREERNGKVSHNREEVGKDSNGD